MREVAMTYGHAPNVTYGSSVIDPRSRISGSSVIDPEGRSVSNTPRVLGLIDPDSVGAAGPPRSKDRVGPDPRSKVRI